MSLLSIFLEYFYLRVCLVYVAEIRMCTHVRISIKLEQVRFPNGNEYLIMRRARGHSKIEKIRDEFPFLRANDTRLSPPSPLGNVGTSREKKRRQYLMNLRAN